MAQASPCPCPCGWSNTTHAHINFVLVSPGGLSREPLRAGVDRSALECLQCGCKQLATEWGCVQHFGCGSPKRAWFALGDSSAAVWAEPRGDVHAFLSGCVSPACGVACGAAEQAGRALFARGRTSACLPCCKRVHTTATSGCRECRFAVHVEHGGDTGRPEGFSWFFAPRTAACQQATGSMNVCGGGVDLLGLGRHLVL